MTGETGAIVRAEILKEWIVCRRRWPIHIERRNEALGINVCFRPWDNGRRDLRRVLDVLEDAHSLRVGNGTALRGAANVTGLRQGRRCGEGAGEERRTRCDISVRAAKTHVQGR